MPLQPDHFVEPVGELAEHLFPPTREERRGGLTARQKLFDLLTTWISQGETRAAALADGAPRDAAVEEWVYHRAKRAVYSRLVSAPSDVSADGQGSQKYTQKQIDAFALEAAAHLSSFETFVAAHLVVTPRRKRRRPVTCVVSASPDFSRL